MKKIFVIVFITAALSGCLSGGYQFHMAAPVDNPGMAFEDDNIKMDFMMHEVVIGMSKNYAAVNFILTNKTDQPITIDWNKVSFIDVHGVSGNAVMHSGMRYNECSSPKAPTTIPPKGKAVDSVTPCYALNFIPYGSLSRWEIAIIPKRHKGPVKIGFYMPLQIGDVTLNYEFVFDGLETKN